MGVPFQSLWMTHPVARLFTSLLLKYPHFKKVCKIFHVLFQIAFWSQDTQTKVLQNLSSMLFVIIDNEVIMGFKKRFCFFFLLFFSQCCHCNLTHEWWVLPWQATLIYMFALIILSEETNKNSLWKKTPMSQWYVKNNPKLIT